jgi:D-arginine dehydrogenase
LTNIESTTYRYFNTCQVAITVDFMVPVWNAAPMETEFDFIVIGAGIAGASVAAHLAQNNSVCVLEMEDRAGYHTTGRSAASYEPNYGPPAMLAFTRASANFFMKPPQDFCEAPVFQKRGSLVVEAHGQEEAASKFLKTAVGIQEVGYSEMKFHFPILRPEYAKRGFYDDTTGDLDVDLLHQSYLRLFKARGGKLALAALAKSISKRGKNWNILTPFESLTAPVIINAAGAWGDQIAGLAGVQPVGLQPKRRSIGVVPVGGHADLMSWSFITDCAETWYSKPQSGKLLVSSADATTVEPHDAYADDEAIAIGIDRMMQATTLDVQRLEHSWGGLRTFAPDTSPVVGFDPSTDGFFWLVGQGGYGIQSSPALSRTAAAMVLKQEIPADVLAAGLNVAHILPDRFRG